MKLAAKANLSLHRREQSQTGGGNKPPSPSPEDLAVMAIAPHDFIIEVNDYDSDAMITNASSTVEEHTIVVDPDVGQTSAEPIVMAVVNENAESMTYTSEALELEGVDMGSGSKTQKKRKFRNEEGRQAIINSNLDLKKRQVEILEVEHSNKVEIQKLEIKKLQSETRQAEAFEVEHSNKVEIQKLKIRKLQLEIALLEHTKAKE
nr:uncharacterized protein LOC110377387 [Helicoverpa armigera]